MIDIFMPIQSFLKFDKVSIDNNVFRMHYRVTVIMLLVFCVLVTSKQFFGEPMQCLGDEAYSGIMNSYCWIYGTFTLNSRLNGTPGKDNVYPGVGPDSGKPNDQMVHTYYQWVCFVLLGQAVLFYAPRYLWKSWEGGRLKALAANLSGPIIPEEWSATRRKQIIEFLNQGNVYSHNLYALRYAFCELLNLVNVIGQIYLLNIFLNGSFLTYGATVAAFNRHYSIPNARINYYPASPLDKYFPKMTKCLFRYVGPSGSYSDRDWLCVLTLNIIHEKIFVLLWFWLMALSLVSLLSVAFRIITFTTPPVRTMLIMGKVRFVKRSIVSKIVNRCKFGDWFVLYLLGKNLNPLLFKELIYELSQDMDTEKIIV